MKWSYVSSYELLDSWKEARHRWGHSLHKMCSRTGSFPPSLARYFIEKFSSPNQRILDSFSGKGTVPLESCLAGRIGIGNDLSPEAYVLTHSIVRPVYLRKVKNYLNSLRQEEFYKEALSYETTNENVKIFYHSYTLKQILLLREILKYDNSDLKIFIKALVCGILHGNSLISLSLPCSHSFSMSPRYVKRYAEEHNLVRPKRDVLKCIELKAKQVLYEGLPITKGYAYQKKASKLRLWKRSINLIITSPPYFNKQTYAWDNWLRLWFLNYDYKEVGAKLLHTGSKTKYIEKIKSCIDKMYELLKNNSACFIVIGDAKLRGKHVNSAEMLAEVSESVGFTVHRIIVDNIPIEKKYFMYIPRDMGIRTDKILELHKGNVEENNIRIHWNQISNNCMDNMKFELKPLEKKPSRRYRKGGKYDPIMDSFIEGTNNLVEVTVEGKDANYLRTQLNKRIEARGIKKVKTSVVNNVLYLEKL